MRYASRLSAWVFCVTAQAWCAIAITANATPTPPSIPSEADAPPALSAAVTVPTSSVVTINLQTDKSWASPRNWLSFLAIILSLSSFAYTVRSQLKSRKQSVNDEFWFRKVAYPLILEPIAATFTDTASKLPADYLSISGDGTHDSATLDIGKFCSEFQETLEQQRGRLMMLSATFEHDRAQATYTKMSEALEFFEDAVIMYCHEVETALANKRRPKISRTATIQKIQTSLTAFISPVKKWQHST